MQKTKEKMEFKESQDIQFEFREGEEQTTLTRSATGELEKRKVADNGNTKSGSFFSQPLWWIFYTLLIVAGLFGGAVAFNPKLSPHNLPLRVIKTSRPRQLSQQLAKLSPLQALFVHLPSTK